MPSVGKIGYRWHGDGVEQYLYMQPLEEPSECDWIDAVKQVLDNYRTERIFMVIDITGHSPVLTKQGFDDMIRHLQRRGLEKSTVAVTLDDRYYDAVARMFEASSGSYGFELVMSAFRSPDEAVRWLEQQMTAPGV